MYNCYFSGWHSLDVSQKLPTQGMVDGSASKPALRQDTGYMVDKPYLDIAARGGTRNPEEKKLP